MFREKIPNYTKEQLEEFVFGTIEERRARTAINRYGEEVCVLTDKGEYISGRCEAFDQPRPDPDRYASPHFIIAMNNGDEIIRRYLPIKIIEAIYVNQPLRWEGDDN